MLSISEVVRDSVTALDSSMIETDPVIDGTKVGRDVVGSIDGIRVGEYVKYKSQRKIQNLWKRK